MAQPLYRNDDVTQCRHYSHDITIRKVLQIRTDRANRGVNRESISKASGMVSDNQNSSRSRHVLQPADPHIKAQVLGEKPYGRPAVARREPISPVDGLLIFEEREAPPPDSRPQERHFSQCLRPLL